MTRKQGFELASSADDIFYKRSFKGLQYLQKDSSCGLYTRNSKTHYLKKIVFVFLTKVVHFQWLKIPSTVSSLNKTIVSP